jgi:hypothetical protein
LRTPGWPTPLKAQDQASDRRTQSATRRFRQQPRGISRQLVEQHSIDPQDPRFALAWEYSLRGYDAMHLNCALLWKETLEAQITMATFDRDLWQASKKAGLAA